MPKRLLDSFTITSNKRKKLSTEQALSTLPETVTKLTFSDAACFTKEVLELIPAYVECLALSYALLSDKNLDPNNIFPFIPPHISSFDLSYLRIFDLDLDRLENIFSAIPATIKSLNLTGNVFIEDMSGNRARRFAKALAALPETLTHLNLSAVLLKLTGEPLITLLTGIPKTVTHLDLARNVLGRLTVLDLIAMFKTITSAHVGLKSNNLYQKSGAELAQAFASFTPTVTSLDLGINELYRKTAAELTIAWAGIPATITHLDLSLNYFYTNRTNDDFNELLNGMPATIYHLSLRSTSLTLQKIKDLKLDVTLPKLNTIYLSDSEANSLIVKKRRLFAQMLLAIEQVIFVDSTGVKIAEPDTLARANFGRQFGGKTAVPSLQHQLTFFIAHTKHAVIEQDKGKLPPSLLEEINAMAILPGR